MVLALGFCLLLPGPRAAFAGWGGGNGSCPSEDGDQVWYMGYDGPNNSSVYYRIEHRNPSSDPTGICDYLALADGLSYWWYSHPFDGTTMDGSHEMPYGSSFNGGNWEVCLTFRVGASALENTSIQLRVYDVANHGDTSGTLLATHDTGMISGCTGFTCYQYGCWTLTPQATQEVQLGHRLALQVRNYDPSLASLLAMWYECSDRCSHLMTPAGAELCTDNDEDGYGDPASGYCDYPDEDCDDTNQYINPGNTEAAYGDPMCSDGDDNDCDGDIDIDDNGCQECATGADCDDGDPCTDDTCVDYVCVYPYNTAPCDDLDACTMDDTCFQGACSGDPLDGDGDGYVSDACAGDDCDDGDFDVNPGADEVCDNGIDDDCDGDTDEIDSDCWECTVAGECDDYDACTTDACVDHVCEHTAVDCDDTNACTDDSCDPGTGGCFNDCNAVDNQDPCCSNYACIGEAVCEACADGDGDGYGDPGSPLCTHPEEDCDDSAPDVNPGAAEVCDNLVDDDCDGLTDGADTLDCPAPPWAAASTVGSDRTLSSTLNLLGMLLLPVALLLGVRVLRRKK